MTERARLDDAMSWSDELFVASRGVKEVEEGGRILLLDLAGNRYWGLDDVGSRIWALIKAGTPCGMIVTTIVQEYDVDVGIATRDIKAFVAQLSSAQLLVRKRP